MRDPFPIPHSYPGGVEQWNKDWELAQKTPCPVCATWEGWFCQHISHTGAIHRMLLPYTIYGIKVPTKTALKTLEDIKARRAACGMPELPEWFTQPQIPR